MQRSPATTVSAVFLCILLCGCATMRYPCAYKVEGQEFKEFKDLDDERALKVVALIYNVKHEAWEDGIARSIALQEYQNLLSRRKSVYIKDSGIFNISYDKVKVSAWRDDDLIRLYDCLYPKACRYYEDAATDLTEAQNAERIMYLTAAGAVEKELKKRDVAAKAMSFAGQVLVGVLSIALGMI